MVRSVDGGAFVLTPEKCLAFFSIEASEEKRSQPILIVNVNSDGCG